MKVFCANYNQFQINLSSFAINQNIVVQTLEPPKYMVYVNALAARTRQDSNYYLQDNYVLSKSAGTTQFNVDLQDLTGGQFYKSTVSFRTPINNTMYNVHVETFDSSNIVYPLLQNNTQYSIVLTTSDGLSTRNLGPMWISDYPSTSKSIIVTTPNIPAINTRGTGNTNISIISNLTTQQITCAYAASAPITMASMVISNVSSSGQTQTYRVDSAIQAGTLSYTVGNTSLNYYATCTIIDTGDCASSQNGMCFVEQLITFTNQTGLYKGFNLNLDDTTMGLTSSFLYQIIALIIVLSIAAIFGAGSYGTGGIIATLLNGFFVVAGWLSDPWWYVTYLIVLAVLIKWSENRVGVAG